MEPVLMNVANREISLLKMKILRVASEVREGHIPSSFSILDLLWNIFENFELKVSRSESQGAYFILSKGHASIGLYAILFNFGFIDEQTFNSYCRKGSALGGHPDKNKVPGVMASTGSLGHGFPIAIGVAYARKLTKVEAPVIVLLGDGELNEGTIWESALLANQHQLMNLICIVDNNLSSSRALKLNDISEKFIAFGWQSIEIDGHNHSEILGALKTPRVKPLVIVANTIKGKGLRAMENNPEWHHKFPTPSQVQEFLGELDED